MNKLFKLVLLFALLFTMAIGKVHAQSVLIKSLVYGTNYTGITNNINVKKLTFLSATTNTIHFYDAPLTTLTYTNNSYSNLLSVANHTNTVIFTNSVGRVNTNSYVGVSNYWTLVAASTNQYPAIGAVELQANVPYVVDVNWNIVNALMAISRTNSTVSVEY